MTRCGDCVLGLKGGAICPKCEGTTFVKEVAKEVVPEKVKKIIKK